MVEAYKVILELYDDMLTPYVMHNYRGNTSVEKEFAAKVKIMRQGIDRDQNLKDIAFTFSNLNLLRTDDNFYFPYGAHVLGIDFFKMKSGDYLSALIGIQN